MTTTKHTPGPWIWRVNRKNKSVDLVANVSMRPYVMGFVRFGTQGAQPIFRVDGFMESAATLAVDIPGQEHNREWNQTLDHPDARLIAAAPELLEALEETLAHMLLFARESDAVTKLVAARARLAIAKATGETP